MTFIREWTDPENSLYSGLSWLTPKEGGATNPGDRSVERVPPPGAVSSSCRRNKKSGHQTGWSGRCRHLSLELSGLCAQIRMHDGPPGWVNRKERKALFWSSFSLASNRWLSDTISTRSVSIAVSVQLYDNEQFVNSTLDRDQDGHSTGRGPPLAEPGMEARYPGTTLPVAATTERAARCLVLWFRVNSRFVRPIPRKICSISGPLATRSVAFNSSSDKHA
jgi:hypothetical protein